jgi:hypothetical protein
MMGQKSKWFHRQNNILNALSDANEVGQLFYSETLVVVGPLLVYKDHIIKSKPLLFHVQEPH